MSILASLKTLSGGCDARRKTRLRLIMLPRPEQVLCAVAEVINPPNGYDMKARLAALPFQINASNHGHAFRLARPSLSRHFDLCGFAPHSASLICADPVEGSIGGAVTCHIQERTQCLKSISALKERWFSTRYALLRSGNSAKMHFTLYSTY